MGVVDAKRAAYSALVVMLLASSAAATDLRYEDVFPYCDDQEGIDLFGCSLSIFVPNIHLKALTSLTYGAFVDGSVVFVKEFFTAGYAAVKELLLVVLGINNLLTDGDASFAVFYSAISGIVAATFRYMWGVISALLVYLIIIALEITKTYLLLGIFFSTIYAIFDTAGILGEKDRLPLEAIGALMLLTLFVGSIIVLSYDVFWGWLNVF